MSAARVLGRLLPGTLLLLPALALGQPSATVTRGPIQRQLIESGEVQAVNAREVNAPME